MYQTMCSIQFVCYKIYDLFITCRPSQNSLARLGSLPILDMIQQMAINSLDMVKRIVLTVVFVLLGDHADDYRVARTSLMLFQALVTSLPFSGTSALLLYIHLPDLGCAAPGLRSRTPSLASPLTESSWCSPLNSNNST